MGWGERNRRVGSDESMGGKGQIRRKEEFK